MANELFFNYMEEAKNKYLPIKKMDEYLSVNMNINGDVLIANNVYAFGYKIKKEGIGQHLKDVKAMYPNTKFIVDSWKNDIRKFKTVDGAMKFLQSL